jgi:hypothetical protein
MAVFIGSEAAGRRQPQFISVRAMFDASADETPTRLVGSQPVQPPNPVQTSFCRDETAGKRQPQFIRASALFDANEDRNETPILNLTLPPEKQGWRDPEEWAARSFDSRFSAQDSDTENSTSFLIMPIQAALDEIEWQQNRDTRLAAVPSDEESPQQPPFIPPPAPNQAWNDDDYYTSSDAYALQSQIEQEDWNSGLATPIFFFDEFEEQWNSINADPIYSVGAFHEDWVPAGFQIAPPVPLEQFNWHDGDVFGSRNCDMRFSFISEAETESWFGFVPVVIPTTAAWVNVQRAPWNKRGLYMYPWWGVILE